MTIISDHPPECAVEGECPNEKFGCKDTCCCGEDMKSHSHPMSCGHTPLSMHDHYCGTELEPVAF